MARGWSEKRGLRRRRQTLTFEYMKKDAMITIRLPQPTRRRLQALARKEGRSLSQQVERLIERGMAAGIESPSAVPARPLSGRLRGGRSATAREMKAVRTLLSEALLRGTATGGNIRR